MTYPKPIIAASQKVVDGMPARIAKFEADLAAATDEAGKARAEKAIAA